MIGERTKKVTVRDVAKLANVSTATVSRALNGDPLVSDDTREIVGNAAQELGYTRSTKSLLRSRGKPGLIYFIMESVLTNAYAQLLDLSIMKAAAAYNLRTVSVSLDTGLAAKDKNDPVYQAQISGYVQEAVQLGARGIVISGFADDMMSNSVSSLLKNSGIPVVFVNRSFSSHAFNCLFSDSRRGTYLATEHLIECGRRDILLFLIPRHRRRIEGFLEAIQSHESKGIRHAVVELEDDSISTVYQEISRLFEERPGIDGILCSSDEIAAGVLRYLVESGKHVPEDVFLIGYNDNIASVLTPPISSVRVPIKEIGEYSIQMILEQGMGSSSHPMKTIMLEPSLIIRP